MREDYGLWAKLISDNKKFINIDEFLVCVNGGNNLYLRRGGIRNAIGEIKLQFYLFKYKIQPFYLALCNCIRGLLLLLPKNILKTFYKNLLRKKD